jgi:hypothetical protein
MYRTYTLSIRRAITKPVQGSLTKESRKMQSTPALRTSSQVKTTIPALDAHGLAITLKMYEHFFADAEIKKSFNQSDEGSEDSQTNALASGGKVCWPPDSTGTGALVWVSI